MLSRHSTTELYPAPPDYFFIPPPSCAVCASLRNFSAGACDPPLIAWMPPAQAPPVFFSHRHRAMFPGADLSTVSSWEHAAGALTSSWCTQSTLHPKGALPSRAFCPGHPYTARPATHADHQSSMACAGLSVSGSLTSYPGHTFCSPQGDSLLVTCSPGPLARRFCSILLCFPVSTCEEGHLSSCSILHPRPASGPGKC